MSDSRAGPEVGGRKSTSVFSEFVLIYRFALVGALATLIHLGVLWLLLSKTSLPVLGANVIAFACAFGLSFSGNYLWTFGARGSPGKAVRRFLVVSLSALVLNSVLLAVILDFNWLDATPAALVSAAVIPLFTFLASRFWGFA